MKYDYSKLQQPKVLNVINMYYQTKELTVMTGTNIDTILLGNGIMFIVENGELLYYTGLSKSTTHELVALTNVMKKFKVLSHLNVQYLIREKETNLCN